MKTKIILTIDKLVIENAKKYAKSNNQNLSEVVEVYLKSFIVKQEVQKEFKISPLVKSLWGSVKPIPESTNYKEILEEELAKKYLK